MVSTRRSARNQPSPGSESGQDLNVKSELDSKVTITPPSHDDGIATHSDFMFKGVAYKSYEEMVMAKRKRNKEILVQSGLLEASAQLRAVSNPYVGDGKKPEASHRGLRSDRKRKSNDRNLPDPPRRKSSRIAGVKADGVYIQDERAGGKFVIGGTTEDLSQFVSSDNVHIEEENESFFNERINDGSDLSVKEAVELADFKYVKDDSVMLAKNLMDDMKTSLLNDDSILCKGNESPKSTACSLVSQIDNLNVDDPECVAKVVPERIYSVAFHPSAHKVLAVAGDKKGHIGFWDVDGALKGDKKENTNTMDGVHLFKPHGRNVSNLEWNSTGEKLYSSSYDGTIRMFDVNKQTFVEAFATYDNSDEFKESLGYGIDEGGKFWTQYMCLDRRNENGLFITTSLGGVIHVDLRGKSKVTFDLTLSDKKINTISLHPNERTVATVGLDCEVNLWDIRKFSSRKKLSPFATQRSSKSVNSAFFSPTGKYLLTTTMSDNLDIIADAHLQTGVIENPTRRIRHNNKTGRWLSTFMAQWHPTQTVTDSNDELFVVGSMAKPRMMEFFSANSGSMLRGVRGDSLTAVVSRCCFHPSPHRLISMGGNSSGRVTIFR